MIDWLRDALIGGASADPCVEVAGRALPVAIRRRSTARRLTMRLAPDGAELRITMPTWGRTADALAFARSRTGWIAAQLAAIPAREAVGPGRAVAYRGTPLRIEWREKGRRSPQREGDALVVGGPQDKVQQRIARWLEGEALPLMAQDLAFYCDRAARPVPTLRLSRAQRRWGSCAAGSRRDPCIRINWRLVMAPDAVRRSVVAHEVAHLTHFDHSPAFHDHLSALFDGDLAMADAWLKREGRGLYLPFG